MLKTLLYALAITLLPIQNEQIYIDANLKFPHYIFQKENKTIYFDQDTPAKTKPENTALTIKTFKKGDEATLIGSNNHTFWKIQNKNKIYYVSKENITETKPYQWNGPVLSASAGTVIGPSGKETYYNLDMSGVIQIMYNLGYHDLPYWIREDGVKMLGDYVMVAADLNQHPKGSIIPCSLGLAIVCDTGSFVHSNPNQLDIAVNW